LFRIHQIIRYNETVQDILDGDLDGFIKAYLMEFGGENKDD